MATSCTTPTCPTACPDSDENNLPEVSFSSCAPEVNIAEIEEIILGNIGSPLADENSASEWNTRFAVSANASPPDPDYVMRLKVVAEKPAAEGNEIQIDSNIKVITTKTHIIQGEILQTNLINYEALRDLECGGKKLLWYKTAGGLLYGGKDGIQASIVMNEVIPKSRKEAINFAFKIEWESKFHPCRTTSPF